MILCWTVHTAPVIILRVLLHQAPTTTLRQLCDDASDSALIEINGVT